jgi:hypothetical protein
LRVDNSAGNYLADAAMNEEMQDKAGKAVQGKARDKESQQKAGAAIAASSDNKLVKVCFAIVVVACRLFNVSIISYCKDGCQ